MLARFDRMLGNWQGSGTVAAAPGQPALPWSSTSRIQRVLGDHFVQEETAITFGDAIPDTLRFVSLIGWDRETETYKQWSISNAGEADEIELHWTDDDTFVSGAAKLVEGQLAVERWTTKLGEDSYQVQGLRAIGAGPFGTYVEGTNRRVDSVPSSTSSKRGSFNVQAIHPQMQKLARTAGDYEVTGEMAGPAGATAKISGRQRVRPIFGGTVLGLFTRGEPDDYQALAAMVWSPAENCYRFVFANNRGEAGLAHSRWVDDHLITNMAGVSMGQPMSMRSILTCDETGALRSGKSHLMLGTADPALVFSAEYEKQ